MNDPEAIAAARRNLVATLILPALLISSGYLLLLRPRLGRSIDQVERSLDDARRQAPGADALNDAHDRVFTLQDELRIERERRARAATAAPTDDLSESAPIDRPIWRREFAELMVRHRIVVQTDRAEEVTDVGGVRQRIRRLELRGKYADLVAALDEFARTQPGGRVLELSMKRSTDEGSAPAWTLTIG